MGFFNEDYNPAQGRTSKSRTNELPNDSLGNALSWANDVTSNRCPWRVFRIVVAEEEKNVA
jgi:hypothetical protein